MDFDLRMRRRATEVGFLAVLFLGIVACQSGSYVRLNQEELAYIIPGSESWGSGDPCAEADCGGPIDVGSLSESFWVVVESIALIDGSAGAGDTVTAEFDIDHPSSDKSMGDTITVRGWGEDVEAAQSALEADNEVWAATRCPGLDTDYVCHFIAFDDQDRFAGLGYGAALHLTTPLAEGAAASQAASGREYVESLVLNR